MSKSEKCDDDDEDNDDDDDEEDDDDDDVPTPISVKVWEMWWR